MKNKLLIFLALTFNFTTAQNSSYVDSINKSLVNHTQQEQLIQILKIPYDKFIGNINTSEKIYYKAIDLSLELNDSSSLAEAYLKLSQVYTYKELRDKKIEYNLKGIKIYEQTGEIVKAGNAYGDLGFQSKYENFEDALNYMRKGIKLIESVETNEKIDPTYDNYGVLQGMLKNYDSALFYHKKSLILKKKNADSVGIPFGYVHLATVHIGLKKFNTAKKFIDSAHTIRLKRNDTYGISDDYVYYGDLYFAQKNYIKAIENFKKGFNLSVENNFAFLQKYCADYLNKSYVALNDYKNAYYFNNILQQLKDSTHKIETNKKVAELQIEFETEKKETEIAQQKEQLLKNELQIKNKNLFNLLLGASILILAIIIYGLFKRQQHKRKEYQHILALKESQSLSNLQNQRLRISRDLHDNIGSQLTFIISSIDNLKYLSGKTTKKFQTKLDEITNFAGETIGQLRDTIWAMNKNEINFDEFHGRILSLIEKAKLMTNGVQFKVDSKVKSQIQFSSICGINLFRIIQEAVNNAVKYSNASTIKIVLKETFDEVHIYIIDDGIGFEISTISEGNGLNNIKKRIAEINCRISINSNIDKGTTIKVIYPKNRTNVV